MSSREDILQSIRRATHVKYEKPDLKPLEEHALTYPNVVEQFYFMMKQVGERLFLEEGQDINKLIRSLIPMLNVSLPIWKVLHVLLSILIMLRTLPNWTARIWQLLTGRLGWRRMVPFDRTGCQATCSLFYF